MSREKKRSIGDGEREGAIDGLRFQYRRKTRAEISRVFRVPRTRPDVII